jgi:polysaccharide biosynthesis protein PslG
MPHTHFLPSRAARLAAAFATFLFLLVVVPAGSLAAEKGLVPDLTWGTSSSTQDQTAAAMADVGSKWSRVHLSWREIETSKGARNSSAVAKYDRGVQLSRQAGSKVIIMVNRAPGWASGSSNVEAPAQNPADLASFMSWLAGHYRGQVDAYEIWNEQNLVRFWPAGVNAGQYAAHLKAAYPAVKQGDPNAKVLFGGLSFSDWEYLEAAYAAEPSLGQYFDVMATHPYTGSFPGYSGAAPPEHVERLPNGRMHSMVFPAYRELRATMAAHGGAKPIWFTEFGWSSESGDAWGVSEAVQADYLARAYRYVEQDPYVQVACWYNFRNNYWSGNANTWEAQHGLMRVDFSKKPSYAAFKAYVPGTAPSSTSDPAPYPTTSGSDPAPTSDPTSAPAPETTAGGGGTKKQTRTRLRVATGKAAPAGTAVSSRARSYAVRGQVVRASDGYVTIRLQRSAGSGRGYRTVRVVRVPVTRAGTFATTVRMRGSGVWRVRATFAGTSTTLPSASPFAYFRA